MSALPNHVQSNVVVTEAVVDDEAPLAEVVVPHGLWTTSVAFHPDHPRRLYIVDAQFGAIFTCDIPS